ncbi:hypothetical protein [Candidatus Leptofilum sp.]|uniref:hypothetical protein n=1 Tax=Candidatus Leptofilum sp. TaxID=3241576 RepID=UPI003B5A559B
MAFYANLGYRFKAPNKTEVPLLLHGSIILSSAIHMDQLVRRRNLEKQYPHMRRRLFDPQLYLAELDANESSGHCAKLATYPWFGIKDLDRYQSSIQKQSDWKKEIEKDIVKLWPRTTPTDPEIIKNSVAECIDIQCRLGCQAIILPSPLTQNVNSNYSRELVWLDAAIDYVAKAKIRLPIYATIAISDNCLRSTEPFSNTLVDLILDTVSAREINGVYLVLEQDGAPNETRHCANVRVLRTILHMVHIFHHDCQIKVAVNFLGQFGLACLAAGADLWGSGWYKSVYRLRLRDKLGEGRARPSYWSYAAAMDIHLKNDFDVLNKTGAINTIIDRAQL